MSFFDTTLGTAVLLILQSLAVVAFVMGSLIFMVYGDRKIWAAVQMRRGPNVVGPWGLLQTFADALKYVVKEIVVPAGVDRPVYFWPRCCLSFWPCWPLPSSPSMTAGCWPTSTSPSSSSSPSPRLRFMA
ncbi:hypothetical protein MASR1M32_26220 [Rhodobacter sp.]